MNSLLVEQKYFCWKRGGYGRGKGPLLRESVCECECE